MDHSRVLIPRRDLELLVIGLAPNAGIDARGLNGITRLTKLLFLLENEEGLERVGESFGFAPYKAGPYSSAIYDDLELLENLDLLQSEITAEATDAEIAELDAISFESLMDEGRGPNEGEERAADTYEERQFRLTERGLKHVQTLLNKPEYKPIVDKIRRVKSRFSRYSLDDILYYVYTRYPDMTTESEIKDKVLRRRR